MTKQYNSLFTEYDSLPPDDQLYPREQAFKDCYELNVKLREALVALYSVTVASSQYSATEKRLAEELAKEAIRRTGE